MYEWERNPHSASGRAEGGRNRKVFAGAWSVSAEEWLEAGGGEGGAPLGPFPIGNATALRLQAQKSARATLEFSVTEYTPAADRVYSWHVAHTYTADHDRLRLHVEETWAEARMRDGTLISRPLWRDAPGADGGALLVGVLSCFSLVLTACSARRRLRLLAGARARAEVRGRAAAWDAVPLDLKLRLLNPWLLLTFLQDIVSVLVAVLYFAPDSLFLVLCERRHRHWAEALATAAATGMAWANLTQYLGYLDKDLSVFLMALRKGVPYIVHMLLSMGPIYLGFCLFGVTFFNATVNYDTDSNAKFDSFSDAAVTLFCVANGDSLQDTFARFSQGNDSYLQSMNTVIGRLFLVCFIVFFIFAVLNIFVAVMEEAVAATKRVMAARRLSNPGTTGARSGSLFASVGDEQVLADVLEDWDEDFDGEYDDEASPLVTEHTGEGRAHTASFSLRKSGSNSELNQPLMQVAAMGAGSAAAGKDAPPSEATGYMPPPPIRTSASPSRASPPDSDAGAPRSATPVQSSGGSFSTDRAVMQQVAAVHDALAITIQESVGELESKLTGIIEARFRQMVQQTRSAGAPSLGAIGRSKSLNLGRSKSISVPGFGSPRASESPMAQDRRSASRESAAAAALAEVAREEQQAARPGATDDGAEQGNPSL